MFRETADSQEPVFRGSTPEVLLDNRVERVFCNLDKAGDQRFFSDSPFNPSFLLILQAEEVYVRENESKIGIDGLLFCNAEDQIKMH
jgi:hypothetical protein